MNILAAIFLLGVLSLITFGIIFRDVLLLIDLIRDFKSSKSVRFTDEELAFISDNVRFLLDESRKFLIDDLDFELAEDDLMLAHSVLDKISGTNIKS